MSAGIGDSAAEGELPGVPWEDPTVRFPGSLILTLRQSLLAPSEFFRWLHYEESLARPLLYYLIVSIVSAFFVLVWRSAGPSLYPGLAPLETGLDPLVQFFLEPFAALFALAFGVFVLQLMVLALVPNQRGFRATSRVCCYAWGPAILTAIPLLGPLLALVWSVTLLSIGIRVGHQTTAGRAAAVVLVPLVGLLMLLLFLALLLLAPDTSPLELIGW
jgi:hypothetical protein